MKFKCMQCGECCSHIRGMISKEDKEFLKEYSYGKLPLVNLFEVEKMSMPLFDFEAKRFREWEKEKKIDAKIKPAKGILDLDSGKFIVVNYYIDYESCPFLDNKKCLVYDKKRGFVCRFFPFNRGPFLETDEELKKDGMFGSCVALKDILPALDDKDRKEYVKELQDIFGDDLFDMVQFDHINEWINKLIVQLMKDKKIRPAINYPYNHFMKRVENSEKIDFLDFLVEKDVKTKEEVYNLVKSFDDNCDAKELLRLRD
ncbi:MAG: YkgJ family cysteine cluster protein [Nanoarchaeota archaeon]|nr:YkgJ family cysteine cluster protein [Nanoarchaeota archaeon]